MSSAQRRASSGKYGSGTLNKAARAQTTRTSKLDEAEGKAMASTPSRSKPTSKKVKRTKRKAKVYQKGNSFSQYGE